MQTERVAEALTEVFPFSGLTRTDLTLLAECATQVSAANSDLLFTEGQAANHFYVIRTGKLALEIVQSGRELVVDTLSSGDVAGFSWLFPPYRWVFDGRVVETLEALQFDGACLRSKCEADPALGYELMKRFSWIVADRMQSARLRLLDLFGHEPVG